jgi:hypothetical protein
MTGDRTSWAVPALTRVLPAGPAAGQPAAAPQTAPVPMPKQVRQIDCARPIKPLLERSGVVCHGGEKPRGQFRRKPALPGGTRAPFALEPKAIEIELGSSGSCGPDQVSPEEDGPAAKVFVPQCGGVPPRRYVGWRGPKSSEQGVRLTSLTALWSS